MTSGLQLNPLDYFQSLETIRSKSYEVFSLVKENKSKYFTVDESKLDQVADFIIELINRDYESVGAVPAHGRWRSFELPIKSKKCNKKDLINEHIEKWKLDVSLSNSEICRRVIDLFVVSVLLDAGAGSKWSYFDKDTNSSYKRTEGLGMACLRMFEAGIFSCQPDSPFQVDASIAFIPTTNLTTSYNSSYFKLKRS
ncbi:Protein urg3 [Smittium mucronatum]|uniref:Protein urg3 n=1 Tax=Smittium mucronatum TaxID=133383 RepID=A0A1R0H3D6_9FUNG|nr:Protein urg3 [Smittium mucronatum]